MLFFWTKYILINYELNFGVTSEHLDDQSGRGPERSPPRWDPLCPRILSNYIPLRGLAGHGVSKFHNWMLSVYNQSINQRYARFNCTTCTMYKSHIALHPTFYFYFYFLLSLQDPYPSTSCHHRPYRTGHLYGSAVASCRYHSLRFIKILSPPGGYGLQAFQIFSGWAQPLPHRYFETAGLRPHIWLHNRYSWINKRFRLS